MAGSAVEEVADEDDAADVDGVPESSARLGAPARLSPPAAALEDVLEAAVPAAGAAADDDGSTGASTGIAGVDVVAAAEAGGRPGSGRPTAGRDKPPAGSERPAVPPDAAGRESPASKPAAGAEEVDDAEDEDAPTLGKAIGARVGT